MWILNCYRLTLKVLLRQYYFDINKNWKILHIFAMTFPFQIWWKCTVRTIKLCRTHSLFRITVTFILHIWIDIEFKLKRKIKNLPSHSLLFPWILWHFKHELFGFLYFSFINYLSLYSDTSLQFSDKMCCIILKNSGFK